MVKTLIVLFLVFGSVSIAYAEVFYNDSVIVNIGDEEEPDGLAGGEEDEAIVIPDSGGGSSSGGFGSDSGSTSDSSTEASPPTEDSIMEVVVTSTEENSGGSTNEDGLGDDSSSSGGDSGDGQILSSSNVLNTLTGSQAVTSSEGGSGLSGVGISAQKVKDALRSRGIVELSIPTAPQTSSESSGPSNTNTQRYSRNDVTLIASALITKNPNFVDIFFTTETLKITYAAQGRLLFAIPLRYETKISINLKEQNQNKRVRINFPWFKFFTWTGVSKDRLKENINNAIENALVDKTQYDAVASILERVSEVILGSRGTIRSSVDTK